MPSTKLFTGLFFTVTLLSALLFASSPATAEEEAASEAAAAAKRPVNGRADCNDDLFAQKFDPFIEQMMEGNGAPGLAIVAMRNGKIVYDRGFGYADVEAQTPVTHESRFRIASVSKPITATAVLQLVEQGKVKLDDRVFEYLELEQYAPEGDKLDARWREVTIAQLLSHTGGWDRGASYDPMFIPQRVCKELDVKYPIGPWEIIRYMVRQPLDFNPGEKYAYSNFGYSMLGRVIEKASGQSYEAYVQKEIFGRLGIEGPAIGKTRIEDRRDDEVRYYPSEPTETTAVAGAGAGKTKTPNQYGGWHHEALDAVGGWCLTAEEMARFGAAIADWKNSPLLAPETIEQMLETRIETEKSDNGQPSGRYYCYGWVYTDKGPKERWHDHSGGLPGTSSALIILADGTTLAVVSNGGKTNIPKFQALLQEITDAAPKDETMEATSLKRPIAGRADCNDEAIVQKFDPVIEQIIEQHDIPGLAAIVLREGKIVYDRGFGYADVEAETPVTYQSRFRIASVSKPITAVAVMQLVEQGKVKLEDRAFDFLELERYVPEGGEFDARWRDVTIAQLLSHTGGWDRGASYDPVFIPERIRKELGVELPVGPWEVIRFMVRQPLDFDPGEKYAYSNFGYCLLGRVIEKASGQPYEAYVQKEIFGRLGIEGPVIGKSRVEDRRGDEVRYYPRVEAEETAVVGPGAGSAKTPHQYGGWHHEAIDAAGGWCLTAEELARFVAAVADRKNSPLLAPETVEQMLAPRAAASKNASGQPMSSHYCYGWLYTDNGPDDRWHDHSGGLPGTSSVIVFLADGTTLAVVDNRGQAKDATWLAHTYIPKLRPLLQELTEQTK